MGSDAILNRNDKAKSKSKYPLSVAFIISNEFCERFNYYGMRTILVLYLTRRLGYSDDNATVLFHVFTSLVYFFPLIGAILADSWLGRFKTIFYLSIVYAIGSAIITIGAIPPLNLPASLVTVIGLILIAIGTGGIKPCVSAFGGDQFKIPEQAQQLATFFSLFYLAINAGSLISTTITPILREDVHCFGEEDCFSLAFGVPVVLMVLSIFVFLFGKSFYTIQKPSGNMIVSVSKCIGNAITTRSKSNWSENHWLDYAEPKYGKKLVEDVKTLLKILVLYIPLPFFWALFDQQGSRWTFQATHMVGSFGSIEIKPDQMQVINPLLIIVFIPLFDVLIYPILRKIGIRRPLQKLTIGMILAGIAFLVSGLLEVKLESTYPILPDSTEGQLRVFNGYNCSYHFKTDLLDNDAFILHPGDIYEEKHISAKEPKYVHYEGNSFQKDSVDCPPKFMGQFKIYPKQAISYFTTFNENDDNTVIEYNDSPDTPNTGNPMVRLLATTNNINEISFKDTSKEYIRKFSLNSTAMYPIPAGSYEVIMDNISISYVQLSTGGTYTCVLIAKNSTNYLFKTHIITNPNQIHILWQLPQYIIMTAAEVMFSVTGLEFSFTQAPSTMKSVLQACWLITVAFGNIIVVIIAETKFFASQANEFFLFAGIMAINVAVFILLALRYTPTKSDNSDIETSNEDIEKKVTEKPVGQRKSGIENEAYSSDL